MISATESSRKVLIVDADASTRREVRTACTQDGYQVLEAESGAEGLRELGAAHPSLVLLEVALPDGSGFDVCRELRKADSAVPVIMMSSRSDEIDVVVALEIGADDYVTKPFSMRELVSRVRAQLRRLDMSASATRPPEVLARGPVEMDVSRHEVRVRGVHVDLTPKEFKLLETFLIGSGRLRTRTYLIDEVWGPTYFGDTKTLDVHVKRLRQKIEIDPHQPEHLVTVRGLGYRFVAAE